ncbi:unnamed protein product, partial [Choristocarpus tenellus]
MIIFHNYDLELSNVQDTYERYKHSPPTTRNMPPVVGNILWARHLLKRLEEPMREFQAYPGVLQAKESRKVIKTYNKVVARTLVAFEYMWYDAWCKSVDMAKAGLAATLIIQHPQTGGLYVNFDPEILQLIREAKCLSRMGVSIPEPAKMVLLQEEKFKEYFNELKHALQEFQRVAQSINPVMRNLLRPHMQLLETRLRPGWVSLTWTSLNIESYKLSIHDALHRLEVIIMKTNDIVDNRIEKNLRIIRRTVLVNMPQDRSLSLEDFVEMQEHSVRVTTDLLVERNIEVEIAVDDLISVATDGQRGSTSEESKGVTQDLRRHYNRLMYQAVLTCTKQSLMEIKKRACSKVGSSFLFIERPFFEVDVQLSVPSVRLSPSLEDIQRNVNAAATSVLGCAKRMRDWGESDIPEDQHITFFEALGQDIEIVKTVLLVTGAMYGTTKEVRDYLSSFRKYDWLWKEDKDVQYRNFVESNPTICDYEAELAKFCHVEREIEMIPPFKNIGALSLNAANLKLQLGSECRQWKVQYADKVHRKARDSMVALLDYIRLTITRLNVEVDGLDSLRYVMNVLKEVRERESTIEFEISPILDMYQLLDQYLSGGLIDKEEMDQKSIIRISW